MTPRNPFMTPEKRREHAAEWRWWRKLNPAGARRAFIELRDFRRRASDEAIPHGVAVWMDSPRTKSA